MTWISPPVYASRSKHQRPASGCGADNVFPGMPRAEQWQDVAGRIVRRMLRRCSASAKQRPRRSAPSFTSAGSSRPPPSYAGCSLALRTLSKRESARGRSLAGDRCPGDYTRRDCASARISPPPALKPTPRRASHRDATEPALPGVGAPYSAGFGDSHDRPVSRFAF